MEYTYKDIAIGDTIITINNEIGILVSIKSYAILNDEKNRRVNKFLSAIPTFSFDNTKYKNTWYSTLTIAIKKDDQYYLEAIDFNDIKKIKKANKKTLIEKIKNKLKWHN